MGSGNQPIAYLLLATGLPARLGNRQFSGVEEMLLARVFRQPFATGAEDEPLECEILFLQTRIGTLQLLGGGASLLELALEVVQALHGDAELLLARLQVVRYRSQVVGHSQVDAPYRELFERFSIFPYDDQLARWLNFVPLRAGQNAETNRRGLATSVTSKE